MALRMESYLNVSWTVPEYSLESSIAHSDEPVAVATNVLTLLFLLGTLLVEVWRRCCMEEQRRSFLAVLTWIVMATVLRIVDAAQRSDAVVVASWSLDIVAASFWLVAMLNRIGRPFQSTVAALLLALTCVQSVALFLPTHVVHHTAMATLSQAAAVVAWLVPNNGWVRCAALIFAACHFGPLFWDVASPQIEHTPDPMGLYLYTMFTTQSFTVCILLSFRKAKPVERGDADERMRMVMDQL